MGPILDRSLEKLGTSDRAIIAARKLLLQAIATVEDGGDPPGSHDEYYGIRAIDRVLPTDTPWQSLKPEMYPVGTH